MSFASAVSRSSVRRRSSRGKLTISRSTELTYDWLVKHNGPELYKRHVIPRYGHIDSFMGYEASRDVYPVFLEQLEACP